MEVLPTAPAAAQAGDAAAGFEPLVREVTAEVTARLVRAAAEDEELARPAVTGEAYRNRVDGVLGQVLDAYAHRALAANRGVLTDAQEAWLRSAVLARVCGLGPLEGLLAEPGVQNIHITGDRVFLDFGGGRRERRRPIAGRDEDLIALVRRIAADSASGERRFDSSAPLLSMELPGGARLSAVMSVARRVSIAIRRHPENRLTLADLRQAGMVDATVNKLLAASVAARANIVIAGATGAGKTTLLRALADTIDPHERIVTIEDSLELNLDRDEQAHPDCVVLQGRPANLEGVGEITLADLVRHALRMSPDRVIVGETRGPETIALLNAMSMGTDGSMATIHASSSAQVFTKIAAYTAQSPERLSLEATNLLIASAVHLVVHIAAPPRGRRHVASIREVVGAEGPQVVSNEIYRRDGGGFEGELRVPPSPELAERLSAHGFDFTDAIAQPPRMRGRS
jgi:Flp pilus assembly CpaF family ATPase